MQAAWVCHELEDPEPAVVCRGALKSYLRQESQCAVSAAEYTGCPAAPLSRSLQVAVTLWRQMLAGLLSRGQRQAPWEASGSHGGMLAWPQFL
jgi:hypothetical protein